MAPIDGVVYPRLSTIYRNPQEGSPSAPPDPLSAVAVEFSELPEVRQMAPVGDFSAIDDKEPVFMPVMSLRKHLTLLRWLGLLACAVQVVAACGIPVATYILVLKQSDRFAVEDYVHWGIALCAGVWGMLALGSMRTVALAMHIVFGAMVAAALAAHNNALFAQLEDRKVSVIAMPGHDMPGLKCSPWRRCAIIQAAYTGCDTCACAMIGACSHAFASDGMQSSLVQSYYVQADLAADGSCPGCSAPSAEFCQAFDIRIRNILLAITGPVTVLTMAVPVVLSLLALLRVEMADGLHLSNRVAQALAMIHQQLIHLNAKEDLRVPLDLLMANVRLIEAEGGPGMLHLADLIRTALARTGFNVPPRDYDNPKAHHGRDQRIINVAASPPSVAFSNQSVHSVTSQVSRPGASVAGSEYQNEEDYWRTNQAMSSRTISATAGSTQVAKSPPESPAFYAAMHHQL